LLGHLLPELKPSQYKGNSGKIVVLGGSTEYSGAPYYAAIASLRSGCDLSHIICPLEASIPIKCYSPEIIVHHTLVPVKEWFNYASTFVVGPGMGRSEEAEKTFIDFLGELKQ
jgi:ATP-dependent NAD(P)H-hydrate dehydratase